MALASLPINPASLCFSVQLEADRTIHVGDRITYKRNSDGMLPTGTVTALLTEGRALKAIQASDPSVTHAAMLALDPEWVSHVGHPVTIDVRRLSLLVAE